MELFDTSFTRIQVTSTFLNRPGTSLLLFRFVSISLLYKGSSIELESLVY